MDLDLDLDLDLALDRVLLLLLLLLLLLDLEAARALSMARCTNFTGESPPLEGEAASPRQISWISSRLSWLPRPSFAIA